MRLRQTIMDSATEKLSVQASRRSAVLRAIESRSADPKLRAGAVAGLLGITPRYVHLLLEETGRSFTQHLLEVRLRKAKVLLCDPCWHQRKIGDVALEFGFRRSVLFQPHLPPPVWRDADRSARKGAGGPGAAIRGNEKACAFFMDQSDSSSRRARRCRQLACLSRCLFAW